ncbi:hypothetical protein RBSWK_06060 [Rhodopirellula baltica SWK14]|uniref:Uncharacterized protein n=1 Tax=Rhodopirellula baltica SWK14 TaxID=993516 RepID=L7C8K5_RHOBT|nr:hypothetical protein RBSWK_06060 [Rhodopirellula baltica SWK14]
MLSTSRNETANGTAAKTASSIPAESALGWWLEKARWLPSRLQAKVLPQVGRTKRSAVPAIQAVRRGIICAVAGTASRGSLVRPTSIAECCHRLFAKPVDLKAWLASRCETQMT